MFVRSKIFPFLNPYVETFHQWPFNKEEITKLAELKFEPMSIQERINEDLKLAIEYSGKQHYHYTPYFHKNEQAFFDQQYRDNIKERKCRENGINLIVVPYTIKPQHIELFIYKKVRELGYQV
jgi:hypothetical protein